MKNWKKYLGAMGLALCLAANVSATTKEINVFYDGGLRTIIQDNSVNKNEFMLPIKTIADIFGYEYQYDGATGKFQIKERGYIIAGYAGKKQVQINGKQVNLSGTPKLINKTVYVPLSFMDETLGVKATWNSQKHQLDLEGKYSVDEKNNKLMVRTKNGKQAVADIKCYKEQGMKIGGIELKRTDRGSEVVTVSQWMNIEPEKYAETTYYIRDGKVIDQVDTTPKKGGWEYSSSIMKNRVLLFDGKHVKLYDDTTGKCIKDVDVKALVGNQEFKMTEPYSQYMIGTDEQDMWIIDFTSDKAVKVIDEIKAKEGLTLDVKGLQDLRTSISIAWVQENAVVVKYYMPSQKTYKKMTYVVGKGFSASQVVS